MKRQERKQSLRRPRVEKLEDRQLFAVAAFQSELLMDVGGSPGAVLTENALQSNDTFFLRVTAREFSPFLSGLRTASVDVSWDAGILEVVEEDFSLASVITPNLPLYRSGVLDNVAGTIEDLSGTALLSSGAGRAIGNRGPETLAMIRMRAIQPAAQASIRLAESSTPTVTVPVMSLKGAQLRFDEEILTISSPNRDAVRAEPSGSKELVSEISNRAAIGTMITLQRSEITAQNKEVAERAPAHQLVSTIEKWPAVPATPVNETVFVPTKVLQPLAVPAVAKEQSIKTFKPMVATAITPTVDANKPNLGAFCVPADHPQAAESNRSLAMSASSWSADQDERFRRRSSFKPQSN